MSRHSAEDRNRDVEEVRVGAGISLGNVCVGHMMVAVTQSESATFLQKDLHACSEIDREQHSRCIRQHWVAEIKKATIGCGNGLESPVRMESHLKPDRAKSCPVS